MPTAKLRPWLLLLLVCAACADPAIHVRYRIVDGYRFSPAERRVIENIAESTVAEVRALLPGIPEGLAMEVRASTDVGEITGAGGGIAGSTVYWFVDPNRGDGVIATAETYLRPMLFHELHHMVREQSAPSWPHMMDRAISAGLAIAFERDFAGASYPWGEYSDEVSEWVTELMALPADALREDWMRQHPDGRRWVARRAGTYLADRAIRASGRSAADLVSTPTDEVLALAQVR